MNYCCETYYSLYFNNCKWKDHAVWPHAGCQQYEQKRHIIMKYRDVLLDKDGNLKPYSDECPFCGIVNGLGPSARNPMTGLVMKTLPDSEMTVRAERHIAQAPDMEVGAALVNRMRS